MPRHNVDKVPLVAFIDVPVTRQHDLCKSPYLNLAVQQKVPGDVPGVRRIF